MEEVKQQGWLALASRWKVLALLVLSLSAQAGADSHVPKGMQRYVIPIKGCAVEFVAKAGGRVAADKAASLPVGWFHHENYYPKDRYSRSLSISLSCHAGNARDLCPQLLADYRNLDKLQARDIQLRRLTRLNPRYYGEAYIASDSGVPTPRRRDLDLCMGNETKAILTENGGINLGYDPREIVETRGKPVLKQSEHALPDVLAIIRSIRFVPDPTPKQDSR
ncbi:hypothetical protein [Cupriavidus taiwanensis]|uniref:hypothetical protein n=1 Tax=Cupriavidus taiwanensis TaxID=164546 RepID=UPI001C2CD664|nr:hypothetical protein [Cupriavidus taiwanensis]